MIHLQELWFSSSKVILCLFTIHLYTTLQLGNHNFELPPSTWRSVVSGWDCSDFMSRSLDLKSLCMLHLLNNQPIFNYFQSHKSCHYPLRKSRKYQRNISVCSNWKVHICEQVLLVRYLSLDTQQIFNVLRLILKTLVNDSDTLNPNETLHSISFVQELQRFQRFRRMSTRNLFKNRNRCFYHTTVNIK